LGTKMALQIVQVSRVFVRNADMILDTDESNFKTV